MIKSGTTSLFIIYIIVILILEGNAVLLFNKTMLQLFLESLKFPTETNIVMGVIHGRHVLLSICDEFIKGSKWLIKI